MIPRWALALAVLAAALQPILGAQIPLPGVSATAPPEEDAAELREPPVFRSTVTLVQVDVYVTDAEGKPVSGLTADDFEILEAGDERSISTFNAVNLIDPVAPPGADIEFDVQTNMQPPGRTYLIALDEVSPDRVLRSRNIARQFITDHLGPNDVAAVVFTGRELASAGQDFTSSRRLLMEAVDRFSGGFALSTPNAEEVQREDGVVMLDRGVDRAFASEPRQLASSLRGLTELLARLPGRKALLYVGEGLSDIDFFSVVDYNGGALTPAAFDAHAAVAAATRGNVTIYPIDPRGLTTDLTPAEALAESLAKATAILRNRTDLGALAEVTGGFALTGSSSFSAAFDRIVQESSTYYTIGFDSEYPRRDGRFVRVEVRMKKPGLQARARNGYVAPLGQERRPEPVEDNARLASVANALSSATPVRDVPMRVFAASYRAQKDSATVALSIELDASALEFHTRDGALASDMEISYLATDSRGRVRPGRRHTATLSLPREVALEVIRQGVRVLSEFELAPGRYQLRVAAGSGNSAGSVRLDLEVPDFDEDALSMSGVGIASAALGSARTLRPHDPLRDVLPVPPTATREFPRGDDLSVFVEVYDNRSRGAASSPIEFTATLTSAEGRSITIVEETRPSAAPRRGSGGHGFTTNIPLNRVPPGAYLIRVEARAQGTEQTVSRTIPIRVR